MRAWHLGALAGTAWISAMAACQQDDDPPPTVASAHDSVGNGGSPDASFADDTSTTTGIVGSGVTTLATGLFSPRAIVLGPSTVYWTTSQVASAGALVGDAASGTGGIESVPRTGGARSEVIAGLAAPGALALSGTTLFFAEGGSGTGTVDSFLLGATTYAPVASGQSLPLPMLVYEGALYWAEGTGTKLSAESVPVAGGEVTVTGSLTTDERPVATTNVGTSLYVLTKSTGGGAILELPMAGGTPKEIWKDASLTPSDLTADGTTLYWLASGTAYGGEVLSLPVSGGAPTTLAMNVDSPAKIAADGSEVYFTSDVASGSVAQVSTGGGGITTLASGLDYPFALVVDDAVYFTTASTVGRVPK